VYKSRMKMWLPFAAWCAGAILCGLLDHARRSSIFLSIYFPVAAVAVVVATRKHRSLNYKFELAEPGVVRSPLGFAVRVSNSCLSYAEGNHEISWHPVSTNRAVGRFDLSEQAIDGGDAPFASEPIDARKKQAVAKAVRSALMDLQFVDAGKIRPKRRLA